MKKIVYGLGLVLVMCITVLILPLWQIKSFNIEGNSYYSEEELLEAGGLMKGKHLLSINKKEAVAAIYGLPLIKDVQLNYHFPNTFTMKVEERRPVGYIKFLDMYLCIDAQGYILEQTSNKKMDLPQIEGLEVEKFVVGEALKSENSEQLEVLKQIIEVLNKYDFMNEVEVIEVTNIQQIHLYVNRLNVIIGNIRDFDKKVKWLKEVHQQYEMGILDLSMIETGQVVLRPLD